MLGLGRARHVGLVGVSAALIALSLADARLGAEPAPRGEGRIAFTFGESGDLHPSQLAVMDADGNNRRVVGPDHVYGLSWSRDGRFIAFQSGLGIYTINVDGRPRHRRVVRNGGGPDWSPSGRAIAFERRPDIWIVNLNDHRQRRIVRNGQSPRWSPDGRKLAFERSRGQVLDLWIVDLATKRERRLVRNGDAADWSPDGRRLVFQRWRPQGQDFQSFMYVMRADGTAERRLFKGQDPTWSPNGQEIAFLGVDARRHYNDAVIRARLDGSDRRVLFGRMPYCGCGSPIWARAPRG